jgi:PAS domain S-box-containing protein
VVDPNGKIITVNKATCELSGYQEEELMGNSIETIFEAAEQISFKEEILERPIEDGELKNYETYLKAKDGKKIPVLFNGSMVKDKDGKMNRIVCTVRDITERKQTEQTLIRSEETAKRLSQENEIIAEIGRIVSSTLNIEEVYERFAEGVKKLIPFDRIVINIINIEKSTVSNVYMAGKGIADRKVGAIYPLEGSGNVEMVCTKSSLLIQTEDFDEYKDRFPMLLSTFQAGFRSIMNVPLFSKGKTVGGLLLRSLKPYAYTDKDVRLAERVGNQIAGAIVNAQLFKDLQKAIAEVKQLGGLLPICSGCKKIRDDKGYWNQIEEYISEHSEAIFSHGLCPDCLKRLYPDL